MTGAFAGLSRRWVTIGVAIVLLALLPLVYNDPYYMTIIVTAEIVLILNISWNFVLGMAGVWNFGQLAIYALGAYGAGRLMLHATWMPAGSRSSAAGSRPSSRCCWRSRRCGCSASTRRC